MRALDGRARDWDLQHDGDGDRLMRVPAGGVRPIALVGYGVGYTRTPAPGVIESLHALDPETGRTLCDRAVAISWSAQEASGTAIDCWRCEAAMHRRQEAS